MRRIFNHLVLPRNYTVLSTLALLALVACQSGTPDSNEANSATAANGELAEFKHCKIGLDGQQTMDAECSTMMVAENPADPESRQIELSIARIKAQKAGKNDGDAVFFFAGGPGQSAKESYPSVANSLRHINKTRDIILLDQRGTGQSNHLGCPQVDLDEMLDDLLSDFDMDKHLREVQECLNQLDGDPRFYTTTIAMQDYETVRQALGYEQMNLIGVSYGTRAAQEYLRRYPEKVRSVILDSVVPPQLILGSEHAPNLDEMLGKLFARCRAESDCHERFGNPQQDLQQLKQTLAFNEPVITMRMPTSGEKRQIKISQDLLAVAIRFLSYASESQAMLPLLLEQATLGDYQPLAAQTLNITSGISNLFAKGMELSVMCSEDAQFFPTNVDHSNTILGQLMADMIIEGCKLWPKGQVPQDFHSPMDIDDVPVLLLSGELDPVTPPRYGDQAAEQFAQSQHWVVKGRGHGLLRHGCIPEQAATFIETAALDELDGSCVEDIKPNPFFMSMTGPNP